MAHQCSIKEKVHDLSVAFATKRRKTTAKSSEIYK
jgi:hypothetical protein